jgi:hypothetical protein
MYGFNDIVLYYTSTPKNTVAVAYIGSQKTVILHYRFEFDPVENHRRYSIECVFELGKGEKLLDVHGNYTVSQNASNPCNGTVNMFYIPGGKSAPVSVRVGCCNSPHLRYVQLYPRNDDAGNILVTNPWKFSKSKPTNIDIYMYMYGGLRDGNVRLSKVFHKNILSTDSKFDSRVSSSRNPYSGYIYILIVVSTCQFRRYV